MKKKFFLFIIFFGLTCCSVNDPTPYGGCGTHNGKTLYRGPKGGCYYINSNNNKTYVSRSECNC